MTDKYDYLLERAVTSEDLKYDKALRPKTFKEYIGQEALKERLRISIEAARQRDDPLPMMLLASMPGLGKTSVANVIAEESKCKLTAIAAPSIRSIADLLDTLLKLEKRSILFIDEIHSLNNKIEEILYSAMEDFVVHVKLGNKEIVNIAVNPFCLIGATTLIGQVSKPLRDRFEIQYTMEYYSADELATIIEANAHKLKLNVKNKEAILSIAQRARGTPRIANRLLKRVRDFAQIKNNNIITNEVVDKAFQIEGIDSIGLTDIDKKYLVTLYKVYNAGPCGLDPLAASCGQDKLTISDFVEQFLLRIGFIARTPRGRVLTALGMEYVIRNA